MALHLGLEELSSKEQASWLVYIGILFKQTYENNPGGKV